MPRPRRPLKGNHARRIHFIPEWAVHSGTNQADIARALNVDKSTVSRWFEGTVPQGSHLIGLAIFLDAEEPGDLFRPPGEAWMARLLRGRSKDEQDRIRATVEMAFPRKSVA